MTGYPGVTNTIPGSVELGDIIIGTWVTFCGDQESSTPRVEKLVMT